MATETTSPAGRGLPRWRTTLSDRDAAAIPGLLAEDAVFRSPAVFSPQEGRQVVTAYLTAAMDVLGDGFSYVDEWVGTDSAVLEFVSEVDGLEVHGVDLIRWDDQAQIISFTVMVRPLKALHALVARMGERLGP